jgi:hypothetical protein
VTVQSFKRPIFEALWRASVDPAKLIRVVTVPAPGRTMPWVFDGVAVVLHMGQSQPRPPRDVCITETGVGCWLSFDGGTWAPVFLPWESIASLVSHSFVASWGVQSQGETKQEPRQRLKAV